MFLPFDHLNPLLISEKLR